MDVDYSALRFWFDVGQFFLTCAIGVYVWMSNRQKVTATRIKKMEADVGEGLLSHGNRLTKLESDSGHIPSRLEMGSLSDKISGLSRELGKLEGRLTGINRAVDLMNEHLLNRS